MSTLHEDLRRLADDHDSWMDARLPANEVPPLYERDMHRALVAGIYAVLVAHLEPEGDAEALAEVLEEHREDGLHPDTCVCEVNIPADLDHHYAAHLAAAILSSDWLAAHDAQVRREAKAEALWEAADDMAYPVRLSEVGSEADAGYYDAHMEISKMLRDRAARAEGER